MEMRRQNDLGHSGFPDAGRKECGFHVAKNGEIVGRRMETGLSQRFVAPSALRSRSARRSSLALRRTA
jgi:hypothetical protein